MKNGIALCNTDTKEKKENYPMKREDLLVEKQPMPDLISLIEQHRMHLKLSKENNTCSDINNSSIISDIEGIFDITSKRSNIKRSTGDIISSNTHGVSK